MAPLQSHSGALQIARECARLGAHPQTIALLTGLPTKLVAVCDTGQPGRRGRPLRSPAFLWEAPLRVQAVMRTFAIEYLALRTQGFAPDRCLTTAYRYYLSFCDEPEFGFDEAFVVASMLGGHWLGERAELEVAACGTCGCNHLRPAGEVSSTCPFCQAPRDGQRAARGLAERSGAWRPAVARHLGARAPAVQRRITEVRLTALGASVRVAQALSTSGPRARIPRRASPPLVKWSGRLSAPHRAALALTVLTFRQLRQADIEAVEALMAAHRHVGPMVPDAGVEFDRSFQVVALSESLWGVPTPMLDVVDCAACGCAYLASRLESVRRCPFCELERPNLPKLGGILG